jgi:hypothetical protein
LSSYLKKLCLTESELVKIVIEAYTKWKIDLLMASV